MKKRGLSPKGFTVAEVMVTLAIVSMLSLGLMEINRVNVQNNKSAAGSMLWNQLALEIDNIMGDQNSCKSVFSNFYGPLNNGGNTTAAAFPDDTALVIPRSNNPNSFQGGIPGVRTVEKSSVGGGGVEFLKIVTIGASNPPLDPNTTEFTLHIEAKRLVRDDLDASITTPHYQFDRIIRITRNPSDNSIRSCSSTGPIQSSRDACEAMGGEWRDTPPGNAPNCRAIQQAQNPNPPSAAAPFLPDWSQYQNLCAAGQAISGIDLSSGVARAACTNVNPLSTGISTCAGGVISWVQDPSPTNPSGGYFICHSLPGANPVSPGGNVPADGRPAIAACASNQHLIWDPTMTPPAFRCTDDFKQSSAKAKNCPPNQIPLWNNSGNDTSSYTCVNQFSPANSLGTGTCKSDSSGMRFLQWDGSKYVCSDANLGGAPSCASNEYLTWDGSSFKCIVIDGAVNIPSCSTGNIMQYDLNTKQFTCTSVAKNEIPQLDCTGSNNALQFDSTNRFSCTNVSPIDYDNCRILPTTDTDLSGWMGASTCDINNEVIVGICGSGGAKDCNAGMSSNNFVKNEAPTVGSVKCCKLNVKRIIASGTQTKRTLSGASLYLSSLDGTSSPNLDDNSHWGNLATCPPGKIAYYFCGNLDSQKCPSGAAVSIMCTSPSNFSVAAYATEVDRSSGGYYARFANSSMGCHIVSGRDYGELAHCGYGEVVAGACGSKGTDCAWAIKDSSAVNQALCCPVK